MPPPSASAHHPEGTGPQGPAAHSGGGFVLPGQAVRRLVLEGAVRSPGPRGEELDPAWESRLQPAGLDLRLGARAWRVRAGFLPTPGRTARDLIGELAQWEMDLSRGALLETGCVYVAELAESLALPPGISARASARSGVGRLNVFTRMIAETGGSFDAAPEGFRGRLYAEVAPLAFPVAARAGTSISQLRLVAGDPAPSGETLLRIDLSGAAGGGAAGYRARRHAPAVDLDGPPGTLDPAEFWDELAPPPSGRLVLDPGSFLLLVSEPGVSVAADRAGELLPFEAGMGEFRVHYAGFFDPGFGAASPGGGRAVLEVRSREVPFAVAHGQAVGRLVSLPLSEPAERAYPERGGPSWEGQGLALPRRFAPPRGGGPAT